MSSSTCEPKDHRRNHRRFGGMLDPPISDGGERAEADLPPMI